MAKPIEDNNNAAAFRTALDVPTNAALNEKYTKPANGIPAADLEADPAGRLLLTATSAAERKQVLGLDQVNNTSDAQKPVSTAQAEALATKMNATMPALQSVFDGGTAAQKAAFQSSVSGAGTLVQTGIPFVLPSSGRIGNESSLGGRLTGLTGLPAVYGWCYLYFPAGAVYAGSAAGWWLCNMTASTNGYIHDYLYQGGQPTIPAGIPRVSQNGPGAYVQTTAIDIPAITAVVAGGSMGPNGAIEWDCKRAVPNNANNKTVNVYLGGQVVCGATMTTKTGTAAIGTIHNRGTETAQVALQGAYGDPNAGTVRRINVDTTVAQLCSAQVQLANAADYVVIEAFTVLLRPKS